VSPAHIRLTATELAGLRAAARSRDPFARRRGRALLALARGLRGVGSRRPSRPAPVYMPVGTMVR
jgi:hypothetical protein